METKHRVYFDQDTRVWRWRDTGATLVEHNSQACASCHGEGKDS